MTLHTDDGLQANIPQTVHSLIYMVSGAVEIKMGPPSSWEHIINADALEVSISV